jgi:hypothetical protein
MLPIKPELKANPVKDVSLHGITVYHKLKVSAGSFCKLDFKWYRALSWKIANPNQIPIPRLEFFQI